MTLKDLQVVHVALEVLDDAGVVGREEPLARVGPGEGADGRVVGLEDRFKVEGEAVPEGELAAGRAGQDAARVRRELRGAERG